ncbi:MAG: SLC13 family permease [Candidatus Neomarinimicrobiota bacterium]
MELRQKLGLFLGIIIFMVMMLLPAPDNMNPLGMRAAAVSMLMAIFWVTEAISIFATSFIPIVLFPLLGILDSKQIASSYGHHIVLLILGAFFVAKAIESNNLHKRIALSTIRAVGTSRIGIMLSFMIATGILSMWTSNNSTTLMMLPIGMAILHREHEMGADISNFAPALMLCIAFSASIGGTGTLIGTPPNLLFVSTIEEIFPNAPLITFIDWLKIGMPFVVLFLPVAWFYLIKYFKISGNLQGSDKIIDKEYKDLGSMSEGEKKVAVILFFYALGFIFRNSWSTFLGVESYVKDSTVAFIASTLLFVLSSERKDETGKQKKLLEWEDAKEIPWGIAFMIGGGLAIAASFKSSGLILWVAESIDLQGIPILVIVLSVITSMVFLTEVNSNAASTAIFLPVLAGISKAGGIHPHLLMIPATIAASCAFMLPSGTGPNASVLASGYLSIPQMAKVGFGLNLLVIFFIAVILYFITLPSLGISLDLPAWAMN